MQHSAELINNGIVGGGGGGGGAAADSAFREYVAVGGGGAGVIAGGVSANVVGVNGTNISEPQAGGSEVGGQSGVVEYTDGIFIFTLNGVIAAGTGGSLGQPGTNGSASINAPSPDLGLGGAAGRAIVTNGFALTQTEAGDIRGAIV